MTTTPNLGLTYPTVGASDDTWGTENNAVITGVDACFKADGTGTSVGVKVGSGKTLNALDGTVVLGDAGLTLKDTADPTKIAAFQCSGITAGQTRTYTLPDASGTIALTSTVAVPVGHISGLTLSVAGSTATFGIAAGQAADSTGAALMSLGSAYTKTMGGTWAVGTGQHALDTGTIANDTWYHIWLIRRSDTGVVDILASTSATSPTMPTNYDQKRRIGAMKTNGSAQWVKFIQVGDRFDWDTRVLDSSGATPANTSAITKTLTVPTGVSVQAILEATLIYSSGAMFAIFSPLDVADIDPAATGWWGVAAASAYNSTEKTVRTNTSAQIRIRFSSTTGNYTIATSGWIDARGE